MVADDMSMNKMLSNKMVIFYRGINCSFCIDEVILVLIYYVMVI